MGLFLGWGAKWDPAGGLGPTSGWTRGEGVCGVAGSQLGDLGKPQMGFGEAAIIWAGPGVSVVPLEPGSRTGCAGPLPNPKISVPGPAFDPGLLRFPSFDPFSPL